MLKNEIQVTIENIVQRAGEAGFNMTGKDIDYLTQIINRESTYDDIIEALIKTEQNEHLKMWVTLRAWERDQFEFPALKYNYDHDVIELVWPNGKRECVFRSITEEKYIRDRWARANMISGRE